MIRLRESQETTHSTFANEIRTCVRVAILALTSTEGNPSSVFLDELDYLIQIGQRQFVGLQEPLGSGPRVLLNLRQRKPSSLADPRNSPEALYGSFNGGTPSWTSTSNT